MLDVGTPILQAPPLRVPGTSTWSSIWDRSTLPLTVCSGSC